jgi:two-component system, NarL family, sensor histidine kinase EvgS
MKKYFVPTINKLLTLGFAFAVLVVIVLVGVTLKVLRDADEAALWVSHSHEVLDQLAVAKRYTSLIEANTLRYMIHGDPAQMDERDQAILERDVSLRRIKELTVVNPRQQEAWIRLREAADEREAISRHLTLLRENKGFEAARAYSRTAPVRDTQQHYLRVVGEMESEERRLLEQRTAERVYTREKTVATAALVSLALAAMFTAVFFLIRRQIGTVEASRSALEVASARVNGILNTVVDGIITIKEHGIVETFNPSAERIFGYTSTEVIGQNIKMLMPEPYHSQLDGYLDHFRTTGEARIIGTNLEVKGRRKDGSIFPMEIAVNKMQPGNESRFIGIVRDISVRKQAQDQQVRSAKELADFKAALDQHAIVATTDARGTITYVNDRFCAISKYAREELLGQNHRIINSGHHPQAFFNELWETIRNGHVWKGEIRNRAKDGSFYWVDTTIVPFLDEHGKPVQYIAIRTDITERVRVEHAVISARDQADRANRTKDSFLATMSHEIRTPLGGLMGMLELLGFTPLNNDQRETVQAAMDSGQSLLRIVNDILDWSKIEAGKLQLAPQPTSLTQLVAGVVNTYARVASANSQILDQHIDARLSSAHLVDPLRLSQVLNNFVSNALKFTPKGKIEVVVELLGQTGGAEQVRFSVKDTGIGIAKEVQQQLFQNYSQGSADTARMYGGTGLGLAICRSLAGMMDGLIDLESAPDMGSNFSITLTLPVTSMKVEQQPVAPVIMELTHMQSNVHEGATVDARVILVVDDHPINRRLMAIQLGILGLRAETAANGEVALAMCREEKFDLIISDCHMPKMDGYELAQAIRKLEADEARPRTPIIAWTANALAGEEAHCHAAGMDELLIKPADLARLKATLSKCLILTDMGKQTSVENNKSGSEVSGLIDLDVLNELSNNVDEKNEILQDFMAQTRSDLADLDEAINKQDLAAAVRIAHRMKGASRMVGAYELTSTCMEIENSAQQGKLDSAGAVAVALQRLVVFLAEADGSRKVKK